MTRSNRALLLGLAAAALAAPAVLAQDTKQEEEAKLVFTFKRASIQSFLGYLSREGGFTFVEEAAIQGDISAVAEKPLTPTQALDVLRAWLLPKDRTILRTGNVVRIMTLEEAKRRGLPVRVGSDPAAINDDEELVTQVMALKYVQASEVKQQLEGLLSDQGKLMIEGTSNSLVISDTSASIRRFAQVLKALDQSVSADLTVKVYRLKNANADEVSKVISELFTGQTGGVVGGAGARGGGGGGGRGGRGRGGGGGMRGMARMFFGGGGGGGSSAGGASAQPVQVSTDPRTNSVVITASDDQIKLVDKLVEELDKDPDPVVTEIRPFPLVNADAASLAQTLDALFEEQQTTQTGGGGRGGRGNQNQGMPRFLRRMMGGGGGGGGTTQTTTDRYSPKPKFTTDERTNTLIASATTTDLDMIAALVKKLDEDPTEATSVLVLQLKHANAANLAAILSDSLSEAGQNAGGGNQGRNQGGGRNQGRNQQARNPFQAPRQQASNSSGGSLGGLSGDVTVVADEEANALVFTSSERNFDRLRAVVSQLDQARREVFIECLIAEVQINDRGELGIQWNSLFTNSAENAKEGSQTLGTDFGLDALTDGLRYTTTSDKFTGLLRALQTEGRLNILSSPKILCLENQEAEISVGQEVPFVTNSRITNNGDTVNTIQYRDVGIILRVEPQINSDGHVRMTVHPEVSSIAPDSQSVPISDGVRSPTFNRNFADTTIVIQSGETAIIGGLIRDELSETEFKIPFLGDIPIIGRLFSSTSKEKVKQEIVVFLTPHVVQDAGQLRSRTTKTLDKFAMVPAEVVRDELDRWLRNIEMDTHPFHYNRGTVLLEGGRVEAAIEDLRKAARLKGGDSATHFNLALALARSGQLEKAKAELRQAALLDTRDAEIPYNQGAVLWRQSDFPRAAAKFKRALQLDPLHESARIWLSKALTELKRIERELLADPQADPKDKKPK